MIMIAKTRGPLPVPDAAHQASRPLHPYESVCNRIIMVGFAVGIDGSQVCWRALDMARAMCVDGRGDVIHCIYVKGEGESDARIEMLKTDCESRQSGYPVNFSIKFYPETAMVGKSKVEQIGELCNVLGRTEYIVVGATGIKGGELREMGHAADGSLRANVLINHVIVKQNVHVPEAKRPKRWCVATDHSKHGRYAVLSVLRLMDPEDEIDVLFSAQFRAEAKHVIPYYEEKISEWGRKGKVIAGRPGGMFGASVGEQLVAWSDELEADFLVLGYGGKSFNKQELVVQLGSTTTFVKTAARCTVVVVSFDTRFMIEEFASGAQEEYVENTVTRLNRTCASTSDKAGLPPDVVLSLLLGEVADVRMYPESVRNALSEIARNNSDGGLIAPSKFDACAKSAWETLGKGWLS